MDAELPQRLAVVAYEMEGAPTGVGRYLEGLLLGLAQTRTPIEVVLFFRGHPFEHALWSEVPGTHSEVPGTRFKAVFDGRPAAHPILWEQLRLPSLLRRHHFDALFSPSYSLPPRLRVPSLVTLHDLSFEHLGEEFGFKERWRRRYLGRRAARRASRVLTDTGEMRRDIHRTYRLDLEKIGVVPLAVDEGFSASGQLSGEAAQSHDAKIRHQLGLNDDPYLLFLGSQLPRRRVDLVIEAFAQLAPRYPTLRLVLSGHNGLRRPEDLDRWIGASGVAERIQHLGYVAEEALAPLYRGAELTLYPSTYEGYGLPPLESLSLGVPAVVSRGLALDDLWPEYPLRLETLTVDGLVEVCEKGLKLGAGRQDLADEAARRLAGLTWKYCAERFLDELAIAYRDGARRG